MHLNTVMYRVGQMDIVSTMSFCHINYTNLMHISLATTHKAPHPAPLIGKVSERLLHVGMELLDLLGDIFLSLVGVLGARGLARREGKFGREGSPRTFAGSTGRECRSCRPGSWCTSGRSRPLSARGCGRASLRGEEVSKVTQTGNEGLTRLRHQDCLVHGTHSRNKRFSTRTARSQVKLTGPIY
jgi:hypothetical protein